MTTTGDIILLYLEGTPVSFARIDSILPDARKDWYHVRLLMLQVPLQVVTWILKNEYVNGQEFFMNGKKMKLERVESPVQDLAAFDPDTRDRPPEKSPGPGDTPARIISLADFKKKHEPEPG